MSHREIDQLAIFEQLKSKTMKQKRAAELLGISFRQVKRKLKDYRQTGPISLVHKSRGKPSHHRIDEGLKEQAVTLIRKAYSDFGPTLAAEKLEEIHNVIINHDTLRSIMIEADLWKVKARKITVHAWRERKACLGEMVQADGSPHRWFEDRAPACTLLAFIDDATSTILWLEFCDGESTMNLLRATDAYLKTHGRPLSLYTDRGGVYKVNIHNEDNDKRTQYARALDELGVELIHARSPQAKGRVERLFGTLQDRLVKELRLAGISTISEANRFVRDVYIPRHNAKFAVKAREPQNLHRSLKGYNLDAILVTKEERKVNHDFTIQYKTRWFQLEKKQPTLVFPRNGVVVNEHFDGKITLTLRTAQLSFYEINKRPEKAVKPMRQAQQTRKPWMPSSTHPWRQYKQKGDILIQSVR